MNRNINIIITLSLILMIIISSIVLYILNNEAIYTDIYVSEKYTETYDMNMFNNGYYDNKYYIFIEDDRISCDKRVNKQTYDRIIPGSKNKMYLRRNELFGSYTLYIHKSEIFDPLGNIVKERFSE